MNFNFLKKCIIITTINNPTDAIQKYSVINDFDLIIVADKKTNIESYKNVNCIFLNLEKQIEEFPEFAKLLPYNHYSRKNIGYLYAFKHKYDIIYDTDDDNIPLKNWTDVLNNKYNIFDVSNCKFFNVYKMFSSINIWPRGYPLTNILGESSHIINKNNINSDIAIIQGLVDGDPDVDAIYRLTSRDYNKNILFDKNNNLYKLSKGTYCPANTQNTYWLKKKFFYLLYIPSFINFRFCDILKMYIAQKFIHQNDDKLAFIEPFVFQERNYHNLMNDFKDEVDMHINLEKLIHLLDNFSIDNEHNDILNFYKILIDNNIIKNVKELELLEDWLKIVEKYI
jgi:hypothetical protein